jgi:hypothetical protein
MLAFAFGRAGVNKPRIGERLRRRDIKILRRAHGPSAARTPFLQGHIASGNAATQPPARVHALKSHSNKGGPAQNAARPHVAAAGACLTAGSGAGFVGVSLSPSASFTR